MALGHNGFLLGGHSTSKAGQHWPGACRVLVYQGSGFWFLVRAECRAFREGTCLLRHCFCFECLLYRFDICCVLVIGAQGAVL